MAETKDKKAGKKNGFFSSTIGFVILSLGAVAVVASDCDDQCESRDERKYDSEQGAQECRLPRSHQILDLRLQSHREQQEDDSQFGEYVYEGGEIVTLHGHVNAQEIREEFPAGDVGDKDTYEYLSDETGQAQLDEDRRAYTGKNEYDRQSEQDLQKELHEPAYSIRL